MYNFFRTAVNIKKDVNYVEKCRNQNMIKSHKNCQIYCFKKSFMI